MTLNAVSPKPMSEPDHDNSTVWTATTPPETIMNDFLDAQDPLGTTRSRSSIPWPGSTFIIRNAATGHVITLQGGRIVLTPPGGRGSIHWACVETKGWLGFKNAVSGCFLGHDGAGRLHCSARRHQGWENFEVRLRPEGDYVLLMQHFERLWHVGFKVERGVEMLAKIGDGGADGVAWEFVKV